MAKTLREIIEVITAILLGLVSVSTAFGAYQASVWAGEASHYSSISQQLRDRNLTVALTAQLIIRDDARKMLDSIGLNQEVILYPERTDAILEEQRVLLGSATPELEAAWNAWTASGYDDALFPVSSAQYEGALFAAPQSMQYTHTVAARLADSVGVKSAQMTVASVVFAFALFLLGVAGVNPGWRIAAVLVASATLVFLAGLIVMLVAIV